jgi:hypothetical protein
MTTKKHHRHAVHREELVVDGRRQEVLVGPRELQADQQRLAPTDGKKRETR